MRAYADASGSVRYRRAGGAEAKTVDTRLLAFRVPAPKTARAETTGFSSRPPMQERAVRLMTYRSQ
jgi:hypothetical protein